MDRFVHSLVETAARRRLPHPAVPAVTTRTPRRVRRPVAVDRGRRVRRHRHLPRQPAGRLAAGSGGRRSSRSAGRGTTPSADHPWVDVDGAAGVDLATSTCSSAATSGSPGSAGARTHVIGEDRRAGWTRAMHAPRPLHHRPGVPHRGHRRRRRGGRRRAARRGAADRRSCAPPTPSRWACSTPCADRGLAPGRDVAVVGFDDSQVAQVVHPGLTSVRQPLEEVAVEIVRALEGLLGHPPAAHRRAAHPDAGGPRG